MDDGTRGTTRLRSPVVKPPPGWCSECRAHPSQPPGWHEHHDPSLWLIERHYIRPCRELDAAIVACVYGHECVHWVDGMPGGFPSHRCSRYLPAALWLADMMDTLTLTSDRGSLIAGVHHWRCEVDWHDASEPDTPRYFGEGEHENPAMAICLAVLAMYSVEIVDELPIGVIPSAVVEAAEAAGGQ